MLRWTFIFIALNVAVFAWQLSVGFHVWVDFAIIPRFAFYEPWTFVTSMFLHGGFAHLIFNMIALLWFGSYLEHLIGRRYFFTLYVTSGVVGNLGYVLTAFNPFMPAVGASGAVYGVIGALTAIRPWTLVLIGGFMPMPLVLAAALWALMDFLGLFVPSGIAHGAHLGGLVFGLAYGLYVKRELRRRYYERLLRDVIRKLPNSAA